MIRIDDPDTLVVRAANYIQREHAPTYLALRFLLNTIPEAKRAAWIENFISRKIDARVQLSYRRVPVLKSLDGNGKSDFRTFCYGSPTTLLMESWFLSEVSKLAKFRRHPAVYSYIWPSSLSGRSFQFFLDGYSNRDRAIERALVSNNDVALIADIKNFYPSVSVAAVVEQFNIAIKESEVSESVKGALSWIVVQLFEKSGVPGLPVGSNISHVLANLYLAKLDEKLSQIFPGRYFRYVDDIVIVCPRNESKKVKELLDDELGRLNLAANSDKYDVVSRVEWGARDYIQKTSGDEINFGGLTTALTEYLVLHPEKYSDIQDSLSSAGIYFPLRNIRAVSKYKRYLRYFFGHGSRIPVGRRFKNIYQTDPQFFLENALRLRTDFYKYRDYLSSTVAPTGGMNRRWWVRAWRYTLSRSLYLYPPDELRMLASNDEVPVELSDIKFMAGTLSGAHDISQMASFPGRALRATAELYAERFGAVPNKNVWEGKLSSSLIEGLATLGVHGLVENRSVRQLAALSEHDQTYLKFSTGAGDDRRSLSDFSYEDEVSCLALGFVNADREILMKERFDERQDAFFSGLYVGEYDYS